MEKEGERNTKRVLQDKILFDSIMLSFHYNRSQLKNNSLVGMESSLTINTSSFFSIGLLLILCCTLRNAEADGKHIHQRFCPPQISGNVSGDARNASGLFAEYRGLIPTNITRDEDGARRRCICGPKPCLPLCTMLRENDTGMTYVINDYAKYSAIPKLRNIDGTVDDHAAAVGPENWFDVFVRRPCPEEYMYRLDPSKHDIDEYHLLSNGSLFLPNLQGHTLLGFENFCLWIRPNEAHYTPFLCSPDTEWEVFSTDADRILHIGSLVAVPFIVATVFVYSVLPELGNIHSMTLRSYLCFLAVVHIALAVARLPKSRFEASDSCLTLGFLIYFLSIACFSWLNVISFDLWRRIGCLGSIGNRNFDNDRKKFFGYFIYVLVVSLVMTAVCVGMELSPDIPESWIRPGFEATACWFSEAGAPYYYFGPTGLSICCNICLFISTSIRLCQHEKIMRRNFNTGASGRHNRDKQWFGLYLKMFTVTGVCWGAESLSWFCDGLGYLWLVMNTANALQGLLIFFMFVCKRRIWSSLMKRYGRKKKLRITNGRPFDCIRTPPNIEDSRGAGIQDVSSQSLSNTSQPTQEDTL